MQPFAFTGATIQPEQLRTALEHPGAGGYASFEGWVRDHNEGRSVRHLEYEAYETLALREGERIVAEAIERFGVLAASCVHRVGDLAIGELAVWVGVSSAHRAEAFAACRYIIDEVKHRVPIWKKEHYIDGDSGWVNCEACATGGGADHGDVPPQGRAHEHGHHHGPGHAHRDVAPPGAPTFVPDYSRQIALPDVGQRGQDLLEAASVLVVGAGGLGVPVLQYLVAAGVGRIGIADGDRVDASNLQRQPLYAIDDIGEPKAATAARHLAQINPTVDLVVHAVAVDDTNIDELVADYDLVVECTDNFRSKFRLNDALVRHGKPGVFASVYQYEGQLQIYRPTDDWPCLRCLWPDAPLDGLIGNCAEAGVLGPVPGTLGAMQAMQALRMLLGHDEDALPALTVVDLTSLSTRRVVTRRNPDCRHDRALGAPASSDQPLELEFATLDEARAAGLELIDIREGWERAVDLPALRIERHLALSDLMEGRVGWPDEGRYLIVCAHGVRSLALTERLRELGHVQVWSMRGGLAALAD